MTMLVDSHCHLDFDAFDADRDALFDRAAAAGVGAMVTVCTRLSRFDALLALAGGRANLSCSVGIHPHQVAEEERAVPERLIELARHPKVVGIGETGLDYYYDKSPREDQKASFRAHIAAARETGLPLIVHTRDADADMAAILREETAAGAFPGVLHCFSSGRALAETALDLGLYISLSGIVTFRNAEGLRAVARDVPLDRILVETDAPYLAPVPMRGKRNEPAFVVHTAAAVAGLKGVTPEALAEATTANFFRLFSRATAPAVA
jgi:TatD DNase family protein